ncbi:Holliday junction resolvase RuvX [Chryseobacterium potabilaquae]|uniref:Putative pre-16S rRNA nuclease n=1 Tax=Chryseobacterium potabilaquae TaxID=2675057 RepID=A0A6N4X660_9FLAO|nr:Holliday junction resolvase RuvX [Chryseobacterium potabilaquae]CAA7196137.1 Putative pre-16S rRNA nuclease [Chryseobacterium potabilaquae]
MGQIISIDYGKVRSGIAATDDMQIIASGVDTIQTNFLLEFLNQYFSQNKVDGAVVGLPVDLKGNISDVEEDILKFIEEFEKKFPNIPVYRLDERFTSKIASFFISQSGKNKKQRQEKGLIDKVSATILLQNFLEKRIR